MGGSLTRLYWCLCACELVWAMAHALLLLGPACMMTDDKKAGGGQQHRVTMKPSPLTHTGRAAQRTRAPCLKNPNSCLPSATLLFSPPLSMLRSHLLLLALLSRRGAPAPELPMTPQDVATAHLTPPVPGTRLAAHAAPDLPFHNHTGQASKVLMHCSLQATSS